MFAVWLLIPWMEKILHQLPILKFLWNAVDHGAITGSRPQHVGWRNRWSHRWHDRGIMCILMKKRSPRHSRLWIQDPFKSRGQRNLQTPFSLSRELQVLLLWDMKTFMPVPGERLWALRREVWLVGFFSTHHIWSLVRCGCSLGQLGSHHSPAQLLCCGSGLVWSLNRGAQAGKCRRNITQPAVETAVPTKQQHPNPNKKQETGFTLKKDTDKRWWESKSTTETEWCFQLLHSKHFFFGALQGLEGQVSFRAPTGLDVQKVIVLEALKGRASEKCASCRLGGGRLSDTQHLPLSLSIKGYVW
jgi:hypothetical protein